MLRIADLFDSKNNFITKVKYMINENDEKLLTIIPKSRDEFIMFDPKEKIVLVSYSLEYTFFYTIRFKEVKLISNNHYYSFEVSSFSVSLNQRDEYRQPTNLEGFVHDKNYINPVKILDKSSGGLKIQSENPISGSKVMISYKDNYDMPKNVASQIKWKTYENGYYVYGLQTSV